MFCDIRKIGTLFIRRQLFTAKQFVSDNIKGFNTDRFLKMHQTFHQISKQYFFALFISLWCFITPPVTAVIFKNRPNRMQGVYCCFFTRSVYPFIKGILYEFIKLLRL